MCNILKSYSYENKSKFQNNERRLNYCRVYRKANEREVFSLFFV